MAALRPDLVPHDLPVLAACAAAVAIGSTSPDIDQGRGPLGWVLRFACFGHRALTHSLLGLCLANALVAAGLTAVATALPALNLPVAPTTAAFLLGMASHLTLDALTPQGIPLLWPVPLDVRLIPLRGLAIRTGSWVERMIVGPLLLVVAAWSVLRLWSAVALLFGWA